MPRLFVYTSPRRTAIALKLPDELNFLAAFHSNLLIMLASPTGFEPVLSP